MTFLSLWNVFLYQRWSLILMCTLFGTNTAIPISWCLSLHGIFSSFLLLCLSVSLKVTLCRQHVAESNTLYFLIGVYIQVINIFIVLCWSFPFLYSSFSSFPWLLEYIYNNCFKVCEKFHHPGHLGVCFYGVTLIFSSHNFLLFVGFCTDSEYSDLSLSYAFKYLIFISYPQIIIAIYEKYAAITRNRTSFHYVFRFFCEIIGVL